MVAERGGATTPWFIPAHSRVHTPRGARDDRARPRASSAHGARRRSRLAEGHARDHADSVGEHVPGGLGTRLLSTETAIKRHTEDLVNFAESIEIAGRSFCGLQEQLKAYDAKDEERARAFEARRIALEQAVNSLRSAPSGGAQGNYDIGSHLQYAASAAQPASASAATPFINANGAVVNPVHHGMSGF